MYFVIGWQFHNTHLNLQHPHSLYINAYRRVLIRCFPSVTYCEPFMSSESIDIQSKPEDPHGWI